MAREASYNRQEVLQKAMELFWAQGFDATSMRDLVATTGLNSRTMYSLFGGKEGLYLEALRTYDCRMLEPGRNVLSRERGMQALRFFFESFFGWEPAVDNGCLFINTLSEKPAVSEEAVELVQEHLDCLEKLFTERLQEARKDGEFVHEPAVVASQLVVSLVGLSQLAKIDREQMRHRGALMLDSFGIQ